MDFPLRIRHSPGFRGNGGMINFCDIIPDYHVLFGKYRVLYSWFLHEDEQFLVNYISYIIRHYRQGEKGFNG